MIGLYALVAQAPADLPGARGERLRALEVGPGLVALVGEASPALSGDALRAHEAAVRAVAGVCDPCLPGRFGAAAGTEDELFAELRRREAELRDALELVRGREQMTLRVQGEPAQVSPPPEAGPGARYLEARRMAAQSPELEPLRAALAGFVRAERVERHGRPELLASVYHLIDRGTSPAYLAALGAAALPGLHVRPSGPWPAWSFAPEATP